jgi:hypothetical protein
MVWGLDEQLKERLSYLGKQERGLGFRGGMNESGFRVAYSGV